MKSNCLSGTQFIILARFRVHMFYFSSNLSIEIIMFERGYKTMPSYAFRIKADYTHRYIGGLEPIDECDMVF